MIAPIAIQATKKIIDDVFFFFGFSLVISLLYHIDVAFGMPLQIRQKGLTITMTITFTPTSNYKEVEVEGYGVVKIRPYGAGEELQIAKNTRELEELQKESEAFLKTLKDKYDEDDSKIPAEEKKHFEKLQVKFTRLYNELNELVQGTITSDDPKIAQKLFAELPMTEIRRLITTALGKEPDAEA